MSGLCIKMTGNKKTTIQHLSNILKNDLDAELVSENLRASDSMNVILLTFEKYYLRTGCYTGLSIMLTEFKDLQTADIIGFGGGKGLYNMSWGANSDFAKNIASILYKYGFIRTDIKKSYNS